VGKSVVTRSVIDSGTEAVYKLYAESFRDPAHLLRIQGEARAIIDAALGTELPG
jgi:phosphoglucomutase